MATSKILLTHTDNNKPVHVSVSVVSNDSGSDQYEPGANRVVDDLAAEALVGIAKAGSIALPKQLSEG